MSIVNELYKKNYAITDNQLTEEILKYEELSVTDLWLLPQYPFDQWRKKYDYPRILKNIKENHSDFSVWMHDQGLTDDILLGGYFSDFFQNKPFSKDKRLFLIKLLYKGKEYMQVWHDYDGQKSSEGDGEPLKYEFIKQFTSYYDWKAQQVFPKDDWRALQDKNFNFIKTIDKDKANTPDEEVYLDHKLKLLKMGGIEFSKSGFGLECKKLEFINASGLQLKGTIHSSRELRFTHCIVDGLSCVDLDMPFLKFENSSVKNLQIRNSNIQQWLFVSSTTTGNIIDTSLNSLRIFGGFFNPNFTNCEIGEIDVKHEGLVYDKNFEKTYRTLSKCAKECGNSELSQKLKIAEYDFIKAKSKGFKKYWMLIDRLYWCYGQKPKRLISVMIMTIFLFAFLFSIFPANFKNGTMLDKPYYQNIYNSIYYSIVTFTTLGYGDISPIGFAKIFAAIEAIFGAVSLGFLVACLTRKD